MSGTSPIPLYLYLLGQRTLALRVIAGTEEVRLPRTESLPLATLRRAAKAGEFLAVDPWIAGDSDDQPRALVALWTYAQDHERALAALPADLAPQAIVHAPVGATLLWILPTPYPEAPADGRPAPAAVLAELAEALGTISASPADMLPVPAADADLVILDREGTTDAEALWTWAYAAAEAAREKASKAAAEAAAIAAAQGESVAANAADTKALHAETGAEDAVPMPPDAAATALGTGPETCDTAGSDAGPVAADVSPRATSESCDIAMDEPSGVGHDRAGTPPAAMDSTRHGELAVPAAEGTETDRITDHMAAERSADEATADGDTLEPRASSDDAPAPPQQPASGLIDTFSARDREPRPEINSKVDEGPRAEVGTRLTEPASAALSSDGADDLPAPLRALLVAAAAAQGLSSRDALAEAVLAYGLGTLGTREVHAALGVGLTWKRADGLRVLTRDGLWRKLTELV